jgi:hypothetical protein
MAERGRAAGQLPRWAGPVRLDRWFPAYMESGSPKPNLLLVRTGLVVRLWLDSDKALHRQPRLATGLPPHPAPIGAARHTGH